MPTFVHMVLIRLSKDITDDKFQALVTEVNKLSKVPGVRRYLNSQSKGHDGPAPSGLAKDYNFAITSEFDSKEDWVAYTQDPLYKSLDEYLTPYQEDVCIYQFTTPQ